MALQDFDVVFGQPFEASGCVCVGLLAVAASNRHEELAITFFQPGKSIFDRVTDSSRGPSRGIFPPTHFHEPSQDHRLESYLEL